MNISPPTPISDIAAHAREAADLMRLLAHDRRLLLLCHLMQEGEVTVGALADRVGLSQPAMSQHLQRLRDDGLVATRRAGTTIHYRIADDRVARLIGALQSVFCPTPGNEPENEP